MNHPEELKYAKTHEWARVDDDIIVCGITDHAQDSLGDLVYIELPTVGDSFIQGAVVGLVESVKTASDIYAPISGVIVEINEDLIDDPEIINASPYVEGWMYKIRPHTLDELNELLTADEYEFSIE